MGEAIARWFWLILTGACVLWYLTITVYVAIRGFADIRAMFRQLAAGDLEVPEQEADAGPLQTGAEE